MATRILPDVEILCEMFDYDPQSGDIRYRPRSRAYFATDQSYNRWHKMFSGKVAKSRTARGCIVVSIQGTMHLAHRVAFKMHYGHEPPDVLDHINRNPSDNRIANLRIATYSQNTMNSSPRCDTPIFRGVSRRGSRYRAYVYVNGKQYHIGLFPTAEAAAKARHLKASELFGDFYPR